MNPVLKEMKRTLPKLKENLKELKTLAKSWTVPNEIKKHIRSDIKSTESKIKDYTKALKKNKGTK